MSTRNVLTVTNIVLLIGGVYFLLLAALGQASIYSVIPAALCFISFVLAYRDDLFFSDPFRISTSVFVLILLIAEEYSAFSAFAFNAVTVASIIVNGVLFFLFMGCTLSILRHLAKVREEEMEEEEEEKPRSAQKPIKQTT